MNKGRILLMVRKDISLIFRESFFIYLIIFPILASLVLSMALGATGESVPMLAIDEQYDDLATYLLENTSIESKVVSRSDMESGLEDGTYDAGLIFDNGAKLLIAGHTLYDERMILISSVKSSYYDAIGQETSVSVNITTVGKDDYSLKVRLIPFLTIIAAMIGGLVISASLVEEREQNTLDAVLVTPLTPSETIVSKALFGLFIGLILGIIILTINNAFSNILIFVFMILGTLLTVGFGLIAGAIMDNITDLITRMKIFNIFLQFPSMIILFPQIPQWIGMLFPTYYFVEPILSISQSNAGFADIWWKAIILIICDIVILYFASKILHERMTGKEIRH